MVNENSNKVYNVDEIKDGLILNESNFSEKSSTSNSRSSNVINSPFCRPIGKNYLDLSNRTLGVPDNTLFMNTNKRLFSFSDYIVGISLNNYYSGVLNYYSVNNNEITFENSNYGYSIGLPFNVKSSQEYTISYLMSDSSSRGAGVSFYAYDGTFLGYYSNSDNSSYLTFETPYNCDFIVVVFIQPSDVRITYSNIQLEEGPIASEYEPYEGCLYGLELYDTIEENFITNNYYLNCGIIAIFFALIILIVNAPLLFIRKIKGNL